MFPYFTVQVEADTETGINIVKMSIIDNLPVKVGATCYAESGFVEMKEQDCHLRSPLFTVLAGRTSDEISLCFQYNIWQTAKGQ